MGGNWLVWYNWALLFENDDGRTVNVNQDNDRRMIQEFYLPELRRHAQRWDNDIQMRTQWFQQNGAPTHTARATKEFLRRQFPGHLISLYEKC